MKTKKECCLARATPEEVGIPGKSVGRFIERAAKELNSLHSFMLLRHGKVVAETWWFPYAPEHPHLLFSLSKSFTSTAIGIAISEGCFKIDDPVIGFFPRKRHPGDISEELRTMTVRHLLTMTSGHGKCSLEGVKKNKFQGDWVRRSSRSLWSISPERISSTIQERHTCCPRS